MSDNLAPKNGISIRHALFLPVMLLIPIAARGHESFEERFVFVLVTIALSVAYVVMINFRRKVSLVGPIAAITVGAGLYAMTTSLVVDLYSERGFVGVGFFPVVLIVCSAMCAILMIIAALD